MTKDFIEKIKQLPRIKLLIFLFTIWQYISIVMMVVSNWPVSLVWLNLGLLLSFMAISPVYESLLLAILSIPFYVVLPNTKFDSLSMWRIVFAFLFAVWLVRDKKLRIKDINFLPWDKFLGYFMFLALAVTLLFGRFLAQGLKEILFLANIYLLYIVLINVLRSKQQIFEIIRYVVWSLAIIVTLGFTQLIGTFLTDLDTFWVYWANNVVKLYYGSGFASVALYSNSWFAYNGGRELRMFSIMPDSQSFAYICLYGICIGTALTRSVFTHIRKWLWSGIRFAGLALILSGTRAVWVGMLAPFFAVAIGYVKDIQKHLAKKYLWPFIIIVILFAASPFINQGLNLLRVEKFQENFLVRAQSIYDVNDISNRGRIAIWENNLSFAITHPLGTGLANFIVSLGPVKPGETYDQVGNEVNPYFNLPKKYISAHNLYFQVLVETGFLGLVLFLAFWYTVLRYLWRFVKHHKNKEDFLVYFVAQAFLMVIWIMTAALFDVTLLNDKVLMFFFLNLGLAGLVVQRYHEYEEETDNK